MIATLVHAAILAHHFYTTIHIHTQMDFTQSDDYFVKNVAKRFLWSYFTAWNFTVQLVYFVICLAEDILRLKKQGQAAVTGFQGKIRKAKDFIFTTLFFPCTLFVTTMFWTLYLIDEELVFPKELQKCVPWWVNHSMHSVITFTLIAELLLTHHRYCRRAVGLGALILFLSIYDIKSVLLLHWVKGKDFIRSDRDVLFCECYSKEFLDGVFCPWSMAVPNLPCPGILGHATAFLGGINCLSDGLLHAGRAYQ